MPRKPAAKSPAFQFYPKDFMAAEEVQTMELDEVGAYITLLCADWNEGSIPDDELKAGRLLHSKAAGDDLARIWRAVRPCFSISESPGRLTNRRLAAERKKQKNYRDKQRKKAEKRWGKSPKETDEEPGENSDNDSSLDEPGTIPVQDGTEKGEGSGGIDENSPKKAPPEDADNKEDVCHGNATVMPRQCSSSLSSSSTLPDSSSISPATTTSSAFDHQTARNPEVSPEGSHSDPSSQPAAGDITTLEAFRSARPSDPEQVHSLAFEAIDSLSLPDQIAAEVEEIVSGYPVVWTRDCIQTTRDKQQRILEGTDKEGFTTSPLQYLAGSLSRKLEALKINLPHP